MSERVESSSSPEWSVARRNSSDMKLVSSSTVVDLRRHAVKGLSAERLRSVELQAGGACGDDRRYALAYAHAAPSHVHGSWLHKENFACAFTRASTLHGLVSAYDEDTTELTVRRRDAHDAARKLTWRDEARGAGGAAAIVLRRAQLNTAVGRAAAGAALSEELGEEVVVLDGRGTHQFGNTNQGLAATGDTRTLHIVNRATVRALASASGTSLDAARFRPNIVLDGVPAWAEFGWVGRRLRVGGATLRVIKRTVRCAGVSLDAADPGAPPFDVPAALKRHFPQHGPYLGVYAQVESGGEVRLGDAVAPISRLRDRVERAPAQAALLALCAALARALLSCVRAGAPPEELLWLLLPPALGLGLLWHMGALRVLKRLW